jgi:hypothetical protein
MSARDAAAIEAEIAATHERLGGTLRALRHELALPLYAAKGLREMLQPASERKPIGEFLRANAGPLGLIALGLAWLALQNRRGVGTVARVVGQDLVEHTRRVIEVAAEAAIEAATNEVTRPQTQTTPLPTPPPASRSDTDL